VIWVLYNWKRNPIFKSALPGSDWWFDALGAALHPPCTGAADDADPGLHVHVFVSAVWALLAVVRSATCTRVRWIWHPERLAGVGRGDRRIAHVTNSAQGFGRRDHRGGDVRLCGDADGDGICTPPWIVILSLMCAVR